MDHSKYIATSKKMIEDVKGKKLSIEDRRQLAIELSGTMLKEARRIQTSFEHRVQAQIDRMMNDPKGKVFTTRMTDECFRSGSSYRVADQMIYLIDKLGIPGYLSYYKQLQIAAFKWLGHTIPQVLVPMARHMLRKETERVILPGERRPMARHMAERRKEGVRINLNHLGEAILGESEAEQRLKTYLEDLKRPEIEYISVKISTIFSQISLLAWEDTLVKLEERLKLLYRAAMQHTFVRADGSATPKFVNLDMEEYRDLHLTVDLFRKVLDEPEFFHHSAGIVLQSYLPDSHLLQQELTVWAMKRVASGGAPIKIRIVKGANLAMEKVEASLRGWPQAPYTSKADVDANFKRMVHYAFLPEHAKAAHVGVGSHNLFDISYALLLRSEMGVEKEVVFEMLEGMADHVRRVVQYLSGEMLLYCPSATKEEFVNAVAYLVRRLDENTSPDNFLRHLFGLIPGTKEWQVQANHFSLACHAAQGISFSPRRTQNHALSPAGASADSLFQNEADTDWSLQQNRKWVYKIAGEWSKKTFEEVPIVIGGKEIPPDKAHCGIGRDPSCPGTDLYHYALADSSQADKALQAAEKAQAKWAGVSVEERSKLFKELARLLRADRGQLIGAMMADAGKTPEEADVEISEAIDFVDYYRLEMERLHRIKDLTWRPKGPLLIAPPWNFPCSIPMGGIAAALAGGNCVIFKPAPETIYVGWKLAKICWEAGFSKETLQFIVCEDDPVGTQIIQDKRLAGVILTGATATAKLMYKLRPGLDLMAETGGKNAMIITAMSDRDLAIKDLLNSAFKHAGQKCSACSLAILEKEVYDDPRFLETLRDAAASLKAGPAWNFSTKITPLIRPPGEELLRGLITLEEGESWLLEPKQDSENPQLWSPGIKLGVVEGSFMHQTELFGPVLSLMCAEDLAHAIRLANGTPYGLTSGIHSLDEREQKEWLKKIRAGNCYVNRGITGAIVRRQPFGGCKESSFGAGAKAGGPNYLMQCMVPSQTTLPRERDPVNGTVKVIGIFVEKMGITKEKQELWNASVESYNYHWKNEFSKAHDPSMVLGQDNLLSYVPHPQVLLRVNTHDDLFDVMRVIGAAIIAGTQLIVSGDEEKVQVLAGADWLKMAPAVEIVKEREDQLTERLGQGAYKRIRLLSAPSLKLRQTMADAACSVHLSPVLANGRVELFHYLREISISSDYHRYGNLGERENEERAAVL